MLIVVLMVIVKVMALVLFLPPRRQRPFAEMVFAMVVSLVPLALAIVETVPPHHHLLPASVDRVIATVVKVAPRGHCVRGTNLLVVVSFLPLLRLAKVIQSVVPVGSVRAGHVSFLKEEDVPVARTVLTGSRPTVLIVIGVVFRTGTHV